MEEYHETRTYFFATVMTESTYQAKLIKRLKEMFPGCIVLKNDANYLQGIPDLVVFHRNSWAFLEVKLSKNSRRGPNQEYYVNVLNEMCFAAFIYPENEEEVLRAVQRSFAASR